MASYKYLDYFPQPLKESIIQNRCLPIIGSGFSLNAEIPEGKRMLAWEALGRAFANEMPGYVYSNTIDAISAYEHAYSRPVMSEKMKDFLLSGQIRPASTHEAFCRLQFDIVCTTNFDHLLEDGYRKISKPCRAVISESQLSVAPMKDELTLLKFHGDIDHPDRMVATEEDYDKFLDKNPMLSTYLSNLLITRTPLFIGYSLDDDDFRQIWQVIKNRLGKMTRQGYVIKVNCSDTEKFRYERRGVKVVNIEGDPKDYPQILTELFKEIKTYWDDNVKTYSDNTAMSELAMPSDSQTRLCYFSVPFQQLSVYKDYFFPLAVRYGFVPITADSVVSAGDNIMANVSSIISKSEYFFLDLEAKNAAYDWGQILSQGKQKSNMFILRTPDIGLSNSKSFYAYYKPDDFIDNPLPIVDVAEKWFSTMAEKLTSKTALAEPERLLKKNEFKAAVISAVVQLEVGLRRVIKIKTNDRVFAKGFFELARIASEHQIIKEEHLIKIREWTNLRNRLVHTEMNINKEDAERYVNEIYAFTKKISVS